MPGIPSAHVSSSIQCRLGAGDDEQKLTHSVREVEHSIVHKLGHRVETTVVIPSHIREHPGTHAEAHTIWEHAPRRTLGRFVIVDLVGLGFIGFVAFTRSVVFRIPSVVLRVSRDTCRLVILCEWKISLDVGD